MLSLLTVVATDPLDFLVMADWGGSPKAPFTTAAEISTAGGMGKVAASTGSSFVMAVGDNFYTSGVENVESARFKDTFEDVFTADSLNIPFHVIAGNHDHGGNVSAQIAYTQKSTRWSYPESWYSFEKDLGGGSSIQVVMIDTVILSGTSDVRDAAGELTAELPGSQLPGPAERARADSQMAWLQKTLNSSKATFLVVAGHCAPPAPPPRAPRPRIQRPVLPPADPVWSICEHGPTNDLVQHVKPLLEQYRVTAYIAGHDHCMETFVDSNVDYHGTTQKLPNPAPPSPQLESRRWSPASS